MRFISRGRRACRMGSARAWGCMRREAPPLGAPRHGTRAMTMIQAVIGSSAPLRGGRRLRQRPWERPRWGCRNLSMCGCRLRGGVWRALFLSRNRDEPDDRRATRSPDSRCELWGVTKPSSQAGRRCPPSAADREQSRERLGVAASWGPGSFRDTRLRDGVSETVAAAFSSHTITN